MTARIKISQAGLAAGVAGRSRTDGLATGALVTVEDVSGTGRSTFHLLWVPVEDTTAGPSLAVTGDPDIWTFSPMAAAYGSYELELRDDGIPVERRIFGIRTPANQLLIPALNERASRHANRLNNGADQIDLSEQNASDFPLSVLNSFRYAGWWRSLYELYRVVEFGLGSIANNAITNAKLAKMAANTAKVNATALLADPQDLTVGTNTVVGRVAGTIVAAALVDAQVDAAAAIALSKLATQNANTVVANPTASPAAPTTVALGTNEILGRVAGNIAAIAIGTNTVLGRVAGNIVAAALVNAQIDAAAAIALSKLATQAARSVVANASNGSAVPTAVVGSTPRNVFRVNPAGDGLEFSDAAAGLGVLTATSATISGATTQIDGATCTVLANTAAVGTTYRLTMSYRFVHTAAATPTLTFEVWFGGVAKCSGVMTPNSVAGTYDSTVTCDVTFRTIGASGTMIGRPSFSGGEVLSVASDVAPFGTVDTTANKALTCKLNMTTGVASNTLTVYQSTVERVF